MPYGLGLNTVGAEDAGWLGGGTGGHAGAELAGAWCVAALAGIPYGVTPGQEPL